MGTFPRRGACCGVGAELQLLPVRYLQKHVSLLWVAGAPLAQLSQTGQGLNLFLTF